MYPEELVKPMREELTNNGFSALYSADDVDAAISKKGTTLVMVNSVCGCAAGKRDQEQLLHYNLIKSLII